MDLLDRLGIEVPVAQAGMSLLAGPPLVSAVADAGALGTIGLLPPGKLAKAIGEVRERAPGRTVAVNLLMPFVRRSHVQACVRARADVVVIAFGGSEAVVRYLRSNGILVLVQVGSEHGARRAIAWGVDGLIAQGREAGGHLAGRISALDLLPVVKAVAGQRPVLLAGGIAHAEDTARALNQGADAVVAGTRFVLTHESAAHPAYQARVLAARTTIATTLFGLSWPEWHRVVPNSATEQWCRNDGTPKRLPALINARSGLLARITPSALQGMLLGMQRAALPVFTPIMPLAGMPDHWVDHSALYAGESALRMSKVLSAREAVQALTPR